MTKLQLRLTFAIESALKKNKIREQLTAYLDSDDVQCDGWVSENNAVFSFPPEQKRYWSPYLNLRFEENENGTVIKGRFGPNPTVWTMFIFFYMLFAFIGFSALMYGLTLVTLKQSPWAFWGIPIAAVFILIEYIIAGTGQKIGHDQTEILMDHLQKAIHPVKKE